MTSSEKELESLAGRLRARVAEGLYREAQGALEEYSRLLQKTVMSLPPGESGLQHMQDQWERLHEETRRRVLAGRAHAALRLERMPKGPRPYVEAPQPRRTWQCLA